MSISYIYDLRTEIMNLLDDVSGVNTTTFSVGDALNYLIETSLLKTPIILVQYVSNQAVDAKGYQMLVSFDIHYIVNKSQIKTNDELIHRILNDSFDKLSNSSLNIRFDSQFLSSYTDDYIIYTQKWDIEYRIF